MTVNGGTATLGVTVDPACDRVALDGRLVPPKSQRTVIAINKPRGYLSTCRRGREEGGLVTDLVGNLGRLYPVGRLDRDSEGLLLLTDDGELAQQLTHPRFGKEKEYEVELEREFDDAVCARLVAGVELDDGPASALSAVRKCGRTLSVVLTEGRKRQVRRMLAALGHRVTRLRRVRIAGLTLGNLKPGAWRRVDDAEVRQMLRTRPEAGR